MKMLDILYHQSNVDVLGVERWYWIVHSVDCSNYCMSRQKFYKGKTHCKVQSVVEVIAFLHSHWNKSSRLMFFGNQPPVYENSSGKLISCPI